MIRNYGKLLLIVLAIPALILILMASTQSLESSTDPSTFLDFTTDTIGSDFTDIGLFYAKFETCPVGLAYSDPIDTIWELRVGFDSLIAWDSYCGFLNTGCVITNIMYHVDPSGTPWETSATPPVSNGVNKFLLWALTLFRRPGIELDTLNFWPGGDIEVCIVDALPDDDDYVTDERFYGPTTLPYLYLDSLGMNFHANDTFWVGLLFKAPSNLSVLAETVSVDPIIFTVTAEPAGNR